MKLLTIAIPCYHSADYMARCIDSLLVGGDEVEILIVDEILAVGDDAFQRKSKQRMMELMGGGTTVLFVSHSIPQIREMCRRVLWMDHSRVRMIGEAGEVCDLYERDGGSFQV